MFITQLLKATYKQSVRLLLLAGLGPEGRWQSTGPVLVWCCHHHQPLCHQWAVPTPLLGQLVFFKQYAATVGKSRIGQSWVMNSRSCINHSLLNILFGDWAVLDLIRETQQSWLNWPTPPVELQQWTFGRLKPVSSSTQAGSAFIRWLDLYHHLCPWGQDKTKNNYKTGRNICGGSVSWV